jgi:hypothetical protein
VIFLHDGNGSKHQVVINEHRLTDNTTVARPEHRSPHPDPRSFSGFVAAWSAAAGSFSEQSSSAATDVSTRNSERLQAHEREVALVSVRMLQIQARQDPERAAFYLSQVNDKESSSPPAVLPAPYRNAAERQRQVNDYMSQKIDQFSAAQRRQVFMNTSR